MKNKKIYGRLLIAFLIIMLVLTYASSQIYNSNLPRVKLGTPTSGAITKTYITNGTMEYKTVKELTVPVDCTVKKMEANALDQLNEQMTIASFETKELLLAKYELEIQIENQKNQMTQLEKNTPQYKRLEILKQDLDEELKLVDEIIANGGVMISLDTGIIIEVLAKEGQKLKAGDPLLRYAPQEDNQLSIVWSIENSEGYEFYPQDDVVVTFAASVETSVGRERVTKNKLYAIHAKTSVASADQYEILLDTKELEEENIQYGQGFNVPLRVSSTSAEYETVVPLSAIDTENSCVYMLQEVKKAFRAEQTVVSVPVKVLMKNDEIASITSIPEGEIIVSSDQKLYNGDAVKVLE